MTLIRRSIAAIFLLTFVAAILIAVRTPNLLEIGNIFDYEEVEDVEDVLIPIVPEKFEPIDATELLNDRERFISTVNSTIAIGILTTGKLHERVAQAMNSWWNLSEFQNVVSIFSDRGTSQLSDGRIIPNVIDTKCDSTYNVGLWCKNTFMFNYWRTKQFSHIKWFVRLMDDSYVHMENLLELLLHYDPKEKIVLGDRFCYWGHDYPSGGPGIVFSRAVLEDWNLKDWEKPFHSKSSPNNFFDDVAWGSYLKLRNITVINHMGIEQQPNQHDSPQWKYWMRFENGSGNLWNLPYRPVLLHQHNTRMDMKTVHEKLHNLAYLPLADKLMEVPPCLCPPQAHQKCIWDQSLVSKGRCQWGFDRLECIGPGPWG